MISGYGRPCHFFVSEWWRLLCVMKVAHEPFSNKGIKYLSPFPLSSIIYEYLTILNSTDSNVIKYSGRVKAGLSRHGMAYSSLLHSPLSTYYFISVPIIILHLLESGRAFLRRWSFSRAAFSPSLTKFFARANSVQCRLPT